MATGTTSSIPMESVSHRPVILITGASSGLGAAMAARYATWATVYGTTRTDTKLPTCHTLLMDVTDSQSVKVAVQQVIEREGRIDRLINNAGIMLSGACEQVPMSDVIRQFDVNCFGAMRVTQTVLPWMRERRRGTIINIGSMAGTIPLPYRAHYAASKAALEIWAWSLRLEVRPFGIGVCCIQAGDFQSDLSARGNAMFSQYLQSGPTVDIYAAPNQQAQAAYINDEAYGRSAVNMAKDLERIIRLSPQQLRFRYTAGPAIQRWIFAIKHLLSDRMIEAILERKIQAR